jgi:hypothetical protein
LQTCGRSLRCMHLRRTHSLTGLTLAHSLASRGAPNQRKFWCQQPAGGARSAQTRTCACCTASLQASLTCCTGLGAMPADAVTPPAEAVAPPGPADALAEGFTEGSQPTVGVQPQVNLAHLIFHPNGCQLAKLIQAVV